MEQTNRLENRKALMLWGGIECTLNRVRDAFLDQFEVSGHLDRPEDLDLIASLGIRTLRYPVSWERIAPDGDLTRANWGWMDERMERLRLLQITPIVGLVHHGSGPRHTSLLDPEFPEKLAEFARTVAARYPWVTDFTPVNEPLTTARFAGLYGHWHPHGTDEATFVRCLLTELKGTVLAMRAIREVTPTARLVQTEDMGKTHSTSSLAYQAEFENERRWVTFDLLCGRVQDDRHRMWGHLLWVGIPEAELRFFAENPCPPDVLGINHYITSERFLDERIHRYPSHTHGDNGRHRYADVEAVRVMQEGPAGVAALLMETSERYGLPIAITEAHLGCTREEQMRWLLDVWKEAHTARDAGADVRAVTVWSLFGAYDWDTLLTEPRGSYESGVFDLRGLEGPRETALGGVCRELASGRTPSHPVISTPGWWRRSPWRLNYPAARAASSTYPARTRMPRSPGGSADALVRPLLITGGQGLLADALARLCEERGIACRVTDREFLDIASPAAIEAALDWHQPWAVVNAAGFSSAEAAEAEPFRCFRENTKGAAALAAACARRDLPLTLFSSPLVFSGQSSPEPYRESDRIDPQTVYGRSKAEMERLVLERMPSKALILRAGALFGPWDDQNFLTRALRQIALGQEVVVANDFLTVAYLPDFGHAVLDLLLDGAEGIWHLSHPEPVRRLDLVRRAAWLAGLDEGRVVPAPITAGDPLWAALDSERTRSLLPSLEAALGHFVECAAGIWTVLPREPRPGEDTEPLPAKAAH
ncbi:MAG: sugar nucleotide-binding protein [Cytophagales bacterium]|nr:sugar nucleotide-binding protein [Armatimonadota bacterium]